VYNDRLDVRPPPTHWGQEKLLISEIEFLTPFYAESSDRVFHVVYAGAAPGTHMPILAGLFPRMRFVLVDPAPSMIRNGEYANIEVRQEFMTDELARQFARDYSSILFVSDIRIGAESGVRESNEVMQRRIHRDMLSQQGWLRIMNPVRSMLKFRLPWNLRPPVTAYVGGTVYFPVYGRPLTHECRLVVPQGAPEVDYDNQRYEGQLAYYNQILRPATYEVFGELGCYDCTSFRLVMRDFMKVSGRDAAEYNDGQVLSRECWDIDRRLRGFAQNWDRVRRGPPLPDARGRGVGCDAASDYEYDSDSS
jgi:hypothetical protein